MTIFKPFGYSDKRTLLQILCYWIWLFFGLALHYRKWLLCHKGRDGQVGPQDPNLIALEEGVVKDSSPETSDSGSTNESGTPSPPEAEGGDKHAR